MSTKSIFKDVIVDSNKLVSALERSVDKEYEEYRRSENLLQPDEIKNIRLKYSLSQASFSNLLGFGERTIARYEDGAIQDVCHDNLIRLMDSIDAFTKLWDVRKNLLSDKERHDVESILNKHKGK